MALLQTLPILCFQHANLQILLKYNYTCLSVDDSPCTADTCRNGGQCFDHGQDGFECQCIGSWSGLQCEICKLLFTDTILISYMQKLASKGYRITQIVTKLTWCEVGTKHHYLLFLKKKSFEFGQFYHT